MVQYISNSSWSDTITNENTSRHIITFDFQTIIAFYIFGIHFYFWMLSSTFGFFFWLFYNYTVFNICIFLTVFQRFDKLAFSLCQRALCSLQKILQYRINKITTYRCCHQEVFRQIGVRPFSKKLQNPRENILEKYIWMLQLYFHRENEIDRISPQVVFLEAFLITVILKNSSWWLLFAWPW